MKHNPFAYFRVIRDDPARCARNVPLTQLDEDLAGSAVPTFSFITPNLIHDTHDGTVADGDHWLADFVPRILASDAWKQNGALIITWDEGATHRGCCGVAAGGKIPLVVLTPNGPSGYHMSTPSSHYSLLRTIEDLWGLERVMNFQHLPTSCGLIAESSGFQVFDNRYIERKRVPTPRNRAN